jgi:ABC-2 type transport system permease protein
MRANALRSLSRAMFLGFIRDRGAMIFTILIPVLFLVLLGSIYKSSSTPQVSVVEVGKASLLDQAAGQGQLSRILKITKSRDLAAAVRDVRQGNDDAVVQQRGNALLVRYSIADPVTAGLVNTVFASIVQQANQQAAGRPAAFRLAAGQVEDKSLKPIQYLAPGLLGWAIASGATFGAAITLVGWRENKLLRRLRLAPASAASIIGARIGVSLFIAFVQLAVFLAIASTPYFGLKLTAYWWMAIPIVACGTLAFLSIGLLVGAVAKTQQAATSIANLVILPMAFLGGAFIPLSFAPAWIQDVSYALPLRYLVLGMQDVMARGDGPAAALPAIGLLLGIAAVLTAISARVFRWDQI